MTRSATGRADLLRAIAARQREHFALDSGDTGWFGYVRQEPKPDPPRGKSTTRRRRGDPPIAVPAPAPEVRLPLRMRSVLAVVENHAVDPAQRRAMARAPDVGELSAADAEPRQSACLIGFENLVPWARLMPALRRQLSATTRGSIDFPRLVDVLAGRESARHLPRLRHTRWHPDLVVVLDFSRRMRPYHEDMHALCRQLLRQCGRTALSLRMMFDGPQGGWSDWHAHQRRGAPLPPEQAWRDPPPGTPVLIVSDLGLIEAGESRERHPLVEAWTGLARRLNAGGRRPLALLPLGADQVPAAVAAAFPVFRWSPDAAMQAMRCINAASPPIGAVNDLLALVAATRRVDPPLLRALRRLVPGAANHAGLEGLAWNHADVERGPAISVLKDRQAVHARRFRAHLAETFATRVRDLLGRHHAHLRAAVVHEETLWWAAHADPASTAVAGVREAIQDARCFFGKLATALRADAERPLEDAWLTVAERLVFLADDHLLASERETLEPLLSALRRRVPHLALPDWAGVEAWADDEPGSKARPHWLVEDAEQFTVRLQPKPPRGGQSLLSGPMDIAACDIQVGQGNPRRPIRLYGEAVQVCSLDETRRIEIRTRESILVLAPVNRPRGCGGWSKDMKGLRIVTPNFGSWSATFPNAAPLPKLGADRQVDYSFQEDTDQVPIDSKWSPKYPTSTSDSFARFGMDEFGTYLILVLPSPGLKKSGDVEITQKFRYIEPGTFLMGSPATEPERAIDEGPQHEVTLTQGFWLADTACTQALWTAVMGQNPSHFTESGDQCPVEQVSWDDVQEFLSRSQKLLPEGCEAVLPTEAEWEYACRAGTITPFSFGDQIDPTIVNYDGNYPYAGGAEGEYRDKTVPVKSLPPNPWGLYEMHGNVYEWCADHLGAYSAEPQIDPRGPDKLGAQRAIRGGSWYDLVGRARSAYRSALEPGYCSSELGFRFSLRSQEPGRGAQQLGLAAEPRRGAPVSAAEPPRGARALPAEPVESPFSAAEPPEFFSGAEPGPDSKPGLLDRLKSLTSRNPKTPPKGKR